MKLGFLALVGAPVLAASLIVAVPAGAASPAGSGSISGTVLARATHRPVAGVTVELVADVPSGFFGVGPKIVATQRVGVSGRYAFTGLAASDPNGYRICFDTGATPRFEDQCWKDEPWDGWVVVSGPGFVTVPGQPIGLAAGEHRTGVDAHLYPWTTVSGRVTNARSGAGVAGVRVEIRNANEFGPLNPVTTGRDGRWTAKVEGGSRKAQVCFAAAATPLQNACYRNVRWPDGTPFPGTATPFSVRPAQVVRGIDAALSPRP